MLRCSRLLLTRHLYHLQQKLQRMRRASIRKIRTFLYGILWRIDCLHGNAQSRNKSGCVHPSSLRLMGTKEKSMKKRSSEKALDGMKQSRIKFEQRGKKYGIAGSCENLCFLIPIHHDALKNIESR